MTPALIHAAVGLADVLARENDALRAMDLAAAAAMLDDKMGALDAFAAAQRDAAKAQSAAASSAAGRDIAARLRALAEENRALLERGIGAQGRLLGMLARAAQPAPLRYGARGAPALERAAVALSARA